LQGWANALVAELSKLLNILTRVQIRGQIHKLPVYDPAKLPPATEPGLIAAVRIGPGNVVMLLSNDDNTWRRADNLAVYP